MEEFEKDSCIRGFHVYQDSWTPFLGDRPGILNSRNKFSLENIRDWRLIRENRKSFPPRTICIIRYSTLPLSCSSEHNTYLFQTLKIYSKLVHFIIH